MQLRAGVMKARSLGFSEEFQMSNREVLKLLFPFLEGADLANCMTVCKHWRDIALDDYFWKCLCAKRWPSLCKRPSSPLAVSYYKMFQMFYKRTGRKIILPPRLSFNDLEFFIDIWAGQTVIFFVVVPGPSLMNGITPPLLGVPNSVKEPVKGDFRLELPVEPRFTIPMSQAMSVSVLVGHKDSKIARIINKSSFDYIDQTAHRALAFDYLDFSPTYPFVSSIRAWVSLLYVTHDKEGEMMNVFGFEMDFCEAASSKNEVLWLMDMLDWK